MNENNRFNQYGMTDAMTDVDLYLWLFDECKRLRYYIIYLDEETDYREIKQIRERLKECENKKLQLEEQSRSVAIVAEGIKRYYYKNRYCTGL